MTRKEQKEQRKIDILYKGLELFVKRGYKNTKITDIADELNISVGLLFHYYNSKEELYYELKQKYPDIKYEHPNQIRSFVLNEERIKAIGKTSTSARHIRLSLVFS